VVPADVIRGQVATLIGMVSLLIGYAIPVGTIAPILPKFRRDWPPRAAIALAAVMIPFGLMMRAAGMLGLLKAEIGTGILAVFTSSYLYGIALAMIVYLRHRSTLALAMLAIVVPFTSFLGVFTGGKSYMLYPWAMAVLAIILVRRRIAARWVVLGALATSLVFPLNNFVRYDLLPTAGSAVGLMRNPGVALTKMSKFLGSSEPAEYFTTGLLATVGRMDCIGAASVLIRDTPKVSPFQNGKTIGLFFVAFIPRAIWPDKPIITIGQFFTDVYGTGPHIEQGTAPSQIGEFFINFGYLGIVGGMLFYGLALRSFHEMLLAGRLTTPGLLSAVAGALLSRYRLPEQHRRRLGHHGVFDDPDRDRPHRRDHAVRIVPGFARELRGPCDRASRSAAVVASAVDRAAPIHPLTSLRFVAAILVVLYHSYTMFLPSKPFPAIVDQTIGVGFIGVSFFFVLSGFILAYNYMGAPDVPVGPRVEPRTFFVARFARIYPLYLLALLVHAPFVIAHRFDHDPSAALALAKIVVSFGVNAALVQAWVPSFGGGWNSPGWSLSDEAFFYALFPFAAPLLWRSRRRDLTLAVLCYAATWSMAAILLAAWPGSSSHVDDVFELMTLPLLRLPEFLLGIVLARIHFRAFDFRPGLLRSPGVLLLAGTLLLALGIAEHERISPMMLQIGILPPAFALIISGSRAHGGRTRDLFSRRSFVVLGEASYGVYILHVPLIYWFAYAVTPMQLDGVPKAFAVDQPLHYAAYLIALIGLSVLSMRYFEDPIRR
jgi:peptidoglycan/LPS O-acetylase OafA/YrhL